MAPGSSPDHARGERYSRRAVSILHPAERPLRARELARMIMTAEGVPLDDRRRLVSITCGLQGVLGRLQAQGLVYTVGKPRRWAVVR